MKPQATVGAIIATNLQVLFLLLIFFIMLHYENYVIMIIDVIMLLLILQYGYPERSLKVIHYKLQTLITGEFPGIENLQAGTSFHLDGVHLVIESKKLDVMTGEVKGIEVYRPANRRETLRLHYPSLLPYGGEEFEKNLELFRSWVKDQA